MRFLLLLGMFSAALLAQVADAGEIRSVLAADKCIDVPRKSQVVGTAVTTYTCHGGYNQNFNFNPVSGEISIYSGTRCLSAPGSNGDRIVITTCNGTSSAPASQRWSFSGSAIKSAASGRCVDIAKKSTVNSAPVILWDCHGNLNQQWRHSLASTPVTTTTTSTTIPVVTTTTTTLPPSSGAVSLRVLQWNVEDNQQVVGAQPEEISEIVARAPDVVLLQEVDYVSRLEEIRSALQANQGVAWYEAHVNRDMNASGASLIAILSKHPLSNVKAKSLKVGSEAARAALGATISVDGKSIALISTRNYWESTFEVAEEQNRRMTSWANSSEGYANLTHIYGGDFNHNPYTGAWDVMTGSGAVDTWHEAYHEGTATFDEAATYGLNLYSRTKNNRIDYVFYKNAATLLNMKNAHIQRLRNPPSDHRQVIVNFEVR